MMLSTSDAGVGGVTASASGAPGVEGHGGLWAFSLAGELGLVTVALGFALLAQALLAILVKRAYLRCPPGSALVIYGVVPNPRGFLVQARHRFLVPLVQGHRVLSLAEVIATVSIRGALGRALSPVHLSLRVRAKVAEDDLGRGRAVERLLELDDRYREMLLKDVVRGEAEELLLSLTQEEARGKRGEVRKMLMARLDETLAAFGLVVAEVRLD